MIEDLKPRSKRTLHDFSPCQSLAGRMAKTEFDRLFACRMRYLRESSSLMLKDVGNALGLHHSAVHHWERGGNYPCIKMLPAIAALYKIEIKDFFDGCI